MTTTTKAVTARIPHLCSSCEQTAALSGMATIAPGHRYLRHTLFPNDMTNQSGRPISMTECVACVSERDPSAGLLAADACATFCCGEMPCALPLGHDGDHSCRRCAFDTKEIV